MMKKYFTIFILFIASACFGQNEPLKLTHLKSLGFEIWSHSVLTLVDSNQINTLQLRVDSSTKDISNVIAHPLKPNTRFIYLNGAKRIRLFLTTPDKNLNQYRYTVIDGDGLRLGQRDQEPKLIKPLNKSMSEKADFGFFDIENQSLVVSVHKNGDYSTTQELIIWNKKPQKIEVIDASLVEEYKDERVSKLEKHINGDTIMTEQEISSAIGINTKGFSIIPTDKNRTYAKISVKPIDNIFLYKIIIKRVDKGETFLTMIDDINWFYDDLNKLSCRLDIKNLELAGKYEVILYPKIGDIDLGYKIENAAYLKFEIKEPDFFASTQNIMILSGGLLAILALVFVVIIIYTKRKNKKKLASAKQQQEISKSQLSVVRAQLNPHFMFNALAGIQSLMNEQKTAEANQYLGKFARLTRNVLDNKELISLAEEKTLLDDYLQMEQLRFGFNYQINIQQDVDLNIEIPAMLLQPFVENAVKHGIAEKGKSGEIKISFAKENTDLILRVMDNGNGFDTAKTYDGLGLGLSKSRIKLLNSIYRETDLVLEMQAAENGTAITITLKQWL